MYDLIQEAGPAVASAGGWLALRPIEATKEVTYPDEYVTSYKVKKTLKPRKTLLKKI